LLVPIWVYATILGTRDASAQQACTAPKTTCEGTDGYYASKEDLARVTAVTDPLLRELRACLDAAGGNNVTPAVTMRWDSEGNAVAVKVEAPGYESLACVAKVSGKLTQLQNPHETAIRCEYGCPRPPAPAPAPVPAPVPPPPAPAPTPPTPPSQQPPLVVNPPGVTPAPAPARPQPVQQPAQASSVPVLAPQGPERRSSRYEQVWYGWQALIPDSVAYVATLAGGFADARGAVALGLITWGLGTPIVHMAHAEVGRGFASIGMRIMLPLVGSGIGALAGLIANAGKRSADEIGDAAGTGAIIGAFVGAGGCTLVDVLALGYKRQKVETAITSTEQRTRWLTIAPTMNIGKDRAAIGIGGSF
jgi:hypothetical protein